MRYLKYLCLLLLCVLISCTKTEEHIVILELDIPEGIMPPEGGCVNVRIRANYSWWLEGESKWCVPSIKEGSASEEGELVIFEADAAPESRTARFSFHCGLKKVVFSISQKKQDFLYATGGNVDSGPAGYIHYADISFDAKTERLLNYWYKRLQESGVDLNFQYERELELGIIEKID